MSNVTLNSIVRESWLDHNLSLHYYLRMLNYAISGLRELSFDMPLNIKEVRLPVTSYNAVIVPSDYVDALVVADEYNGRLRAFVNNDALNTLYKFDDQGQIVPYTRNEDEEINIDFYYVYGAEGVNNHGEYIGANYGYVGGKTFGYKYSDVRKEIQFDIDIDSTEIVLQYVSTGVSISSANLVHAYAQECLKAWMEYKRLKHSPLPNRVTLTRDAKRYFDDIQRNLIGRLNPMGVEEILVSLRRGFYASPKT